MIFDKSLDRLGKAKSAAKVREQTNIVFGDGGEGEDGGGSGHEVLICVGVMGEEAERYLPPFVHEAVDWRSD